MDEKDALKKEIIKRFGTPCVVIDLDVVEANIARVQQLCDTAALANRPHIKTHKSPILAHAQLSAGATGITCQKLGEAEVMADADAFAAALVEPLRQFAMAHGMPLPPNQPISLPIAPGHESMTRGLFAEHPVFFVPSDFGEHIHRWPAVAHEAGHVLWYIEPRCDASLTRFVMGRRRLRPRFHLGGALHGGWLRRRTTSIHLPAEPIPCV